VSDAWVYMLRCRDGSLYTGWTSDLDRRMARHQAGKASRYTASRLPVQLALALPMADRTAARREEARIKMLPRPQKLALIDPQPGSGVITKGLLEQPIITRTL
jgi:putative endonuclease